MASILGSLSKEKKLELWRYLNKRVRNFTDEERKVWQILTNDPDIKQHIDKILKRVMKGLAG